MKHTILLILTSFFISCAQNEDDSGLSTDALSEEEFQKRTNLSYYDYKDIKYTSIKKVSLVL